LKKIAFLITDCDFGGAEQILFELCRGLKDKFEIRVLVLKRKGHFAKLIEGLGIPVKSYELGTKINLGYLLGLFRVFFRLRSDLSKMKPDILQGILFQANQMTKLAGRLAGIKLRLCAIHTFDESAAKAFLEKLTSRFATRYVVAPEALKKFCVDRYSIPPGKIQVIWNGIRFEKTQTDRKQMLNELGLAPGLKIMGAIGRLHREKGQDILIRSFSRLTGEFPELRLVIVSDGPERQNLEALAKNLGLGERVIFTGFVPEPEKYFSLFDLFVLPSRIEAMPMVLMQAMAHAQPAVATNVGGVADLIDDNKTGILTPPEDDSSMSSAIARILRNPELSKQLGAAAKMKAEKEFGLEKMIGAYQKLYLDLLEGKI